MKTGMVVRLLYFPGCPNVEAARRVLSEAMQRVEPKPTLQEIDVTRPDTPADLRSWGSPTILVDGKDVAGGSPAAGSCRLYPGSGANVPRLAVIQAALRSSR